MTDMSDPPGGPADPSDALRPPLQTAPPGPAVPPPSEYPAYPAQSGQQPGWSMPPEPPSAGTNGLAVAALVLAFVIAPIGLILGVVALVQIGRSGQKGRGLAIAGVVVGTLGTLAVAAALVVALLSSAQRDDSGAITGGGSVGAADLRVGDCLTNLQDGGVIAAVDAVPCTQSHTGEVFAVFDLPKGGGYPGDDPLLAMADDACFERIQSYAPRALADADLEPYFITPTKSSWAFGDRTITCIALDANGRTGSIKQG